MPPVIGLLTTLAPVLTAAGAAATIGDTIYNATQGSGGSGAVQNDAAQAQATLQAQQAANQKQAAIKAQIANAQEKTGGSVNTPGLTDLASILAGYGGQAGGATPTPFSPSVTGAATSSTPGLQDALSQLAPGVGGDTSGGVSQNFSGGS